MTPHPIESIMTPMLENIRNMIDVDTIVGQPIYNAEGTLIIPISTVSFGFVAGGGEYASGNEKGESKMPDRYPFAGGTGAGVSLKPTAMLIVKQDQIKLLPARMDTPYERIVEMVPKILEEIKNFVTDQQGPNPEERTPANEL